MGRSVLAHVGGGDLPLPWWQFAYAGVAVLLAAHLLLRARAPRPKATSARALPRPVDTAVRVAGVGLRAIGVVLWVLVLATAWLGTDNGRDNLAPNVVWVVLWAGLHVVSAVLGDVWRVLSPFDTIAGLTRWARRRGRPGPAIEPPDDGTLVTSHWFAAAGAAGLSWLELCYHRPEGPRVLAVAITGYSVVMLAGAARFGRGWLRTADVFAAVFGLFAAIAPFFRDVDGRVRVRAPLVGLVDVRARRGTVALVTVLIAAAGFDGVAATSWWIDVLGTRLGWSRTLVNTAGLVAVIAIVLGAYLVAAGLAGSRRFVAVLVPIALGLAIAHYFPLFVVEAQATLPLLGDPFGEGWDLFGFGSPQPDLSVVSPAVIAWVQAVAIVAGGAGAVALVHAIARRVGRPPLPSVVAFVMATTAAGLGLMLGA